MQGGRPGCIYRTGEGKRGTENWELGRHEIKALMPRTGTPSTLSTLRAATAFQAPRRPLFAARSDTDTQNTQKILRKPATRNTRREARGSDISRFSALAKFPCSIISMAGFIVRFFQFGTIWYNFPFTSATLTILRRDSPPDTSCVPGGLAPPPQYTLPQETHSLPPANTPCSS